MTQDMSNKIMTLLWGENTRFSRPFGDKRAELGRQLVANEILASLRWQASRARATARARRDYGSSY